MLAAETTLTHATDLTEQERVSGTVCFSWQRGGLKNTASVHPRFYGKHVFPPSSEARFCPAMQYILEPSAAHEHGVQAIEARDAEAVAALDQALVQRQGLGLRERRGRGGSTAAGRYHFLF